MNGVHDVGGMHGFGPVEYVAEEPLFDSDWARRMFGIVVASAMHGRYNFDQFRAAVERMDPVVYLASPYFQHWLEGLEDTFIRNGIVTREELDEHLRQRAEDVNAPIPQVEDPNLVEQVTSFITEGGRLEQEVEWEPRYALGDRVLVRNTNPVGHTRTPRYSRGKSGVIEAVHGAFVLADTSAEGIEAEPEYVYDVRFSSRELWGEHADEPGSVCIGLWESYLTEDIKEEEKK